MFEIVKDFPNPLMFLDAKPSVSLYQTTHRNLPDRKQDPIVFKNLIQTIEQELERKYNLTETTALLQPFYDLKEDVSFWNNSLDGIAVLANPEKCIVYSLSRTMPNLAVVADDFHIMPLIRAFQSSDQYLLLGLSGSEFSLFQGNRYEIKPLELPAAAPTTINEILGSTLSEPSLGQRSSQAGGSSVFYGHGSKNDENEKDLEKFFRYIDRFVLENYAKTMKLPLILVSLTEYQSEFKALSNNPYLMKEGIEASPDALNREQLRESAWDIVLSSYLGKTKTLVETFQTAQAGGKGSDFPEDIANAVFLKKVKQLIVEDGKVIPGKFDETTGKLKFGDSDQAGYGNVLDALIKQTLQNKGEVVVLPKERMPGISGMAAIFRY
ncbi:MAG: hypothetical protein LLG09_01170 [Negativicutes bacterium]|nr:hypothetical protein [Negativicutes bacterium]